jgi:aminoglycoside phosphotransferase (APT) family kinase protein
MRTARGGGDDWRMSNATVTVSPAMAEWLTEALDDPGPFELEPLSGGNSNETLLLSSPRCERILRRPPHDATIDPSAHSMAREHRTLAAIAGRGVPAPRPLAYCDEPAIASGGFLVMERIDGVALTTGLPEGFDGDAGAVGEAVVTALAALHGVDWREAGLEGFGSPDGFLERQVPRWRRQYERYAVRELRLFEPVACWLEENLPASFEPGIMHGDFHADNCLVSTTAPVRVQAIIDFEMTTIGDPLLDLGLLLAFWGDERPAPPAMPRVQGFSRGVGAPTRQQLATVYARESGRSIEHLSFYMVLALWKLAAIVEGAYAHHLHGNLDNRYARELEHDVPALLAEAAQIADITEG